MMKKYKTQIWACISGVLGFLIACLVLPSLEFKSRLEEKEIEIESRTDGMRQVKYWKGYKNVNARQFQITASEWVLVWRNKSISDESVFSIEVLNGNDGRLEHVGYSTTSDAGFIELEESGNVSLRINCINQLYEIEVWIPLEN